MIRHYFHFAEVESTNDTAWTFFRKDSIYQADRQTRGRGKQGRSWCSAEGNLNLSFAYELEGLENTQLITQLFAVAMVDLLRSEYELPAAFKWPNDVLIEGKKLAGILVEAKWQQKICRLVVGVGINLNSRDLSPEISQSATSVRLELCEDSDEELFLERFILHIEHFMQLLLKGDREEIYGIANDFCDTINRNVMVRSIQGDEVKGLVEGISRQGALLIRDEHEKRLEIWEGDLHYL